MPKLSKLAVAFAPAALLISAAVYDTTINETKLDDTYQADKITHSDMLGMKMDTIYASTPDGDQNQFVVDTGATDIQLGECFKASVTSYYTNKPFSWLGVNQGYPAKRISAVECPRNP